MIAATMFSGIGGPEVAMPHWDWRWHAEIDKFANVVMAARHPSSPNLGDVSHGAFIERAERAGRPDVIVFGSPCQSFSVAGRRGGLDDERGNLALVALGIIDRLKPNWFVFENVPGFLSSDEGRDWGIFLRSVDERGYSGSWAVLDAQWFGLAQRRERVFFVGHAGGWRGPAAVLFEPESLCGDSPPRRTSRQGIAGASGTGAEAGGALGVGIGGEDMGHALTSKRSRRFDATSESHVIDAPVIAWALQERDAKGADSSTKDGHLIVSAPAVAAPLGASAAVGKRGWRDDLDHGAFVVADPISANEGRTYTHEGRNNFRLRNVVQSLEPVAFDTTQITSRENRCNPQPDDPCHPLASGGHAPAVAFKTDQEPEAHGDLCPTLQQPSPSGGGQPTAVAVFKSSHFTRGKDGAPAPVAPPLSKETDRGDQDLLLMGGATVRRLTPRECERLQGFPDDYTLVTYRGKPAADGPRYKALGNAMAVPVIRWILSRIEVFHMKHGGETWHE